MDVRLLVHGTAAGPWNMAVDDALLSSAAERQIATLRFYRWTPATLSLGYFQPLGERTRHPASLDLPVVRRGSGGGAIIHDREWTYSFAAPLEDRFAGTESLVAAFHESLVDLLRQWSLRAELCPATHLVDAPPFLCFQRRARFDLLVESHKICGSAQRRRKNAGLLHGSLLLERSDAAPELPGLRDLGAADVDETDLAERWAAQLAQRFDWQLTPAELTNQERRHAATVAGERFARPAWTARR